MGSVKCVFIGFLLSSWSTVGWAALDWGNNVVEMLAEPGTKEAVAVFNYTNAGREPLRIIRVKNSCGCTTSEYGKGNIAPGQSGELKATFDIGSRRGMQKKTIEVTTDDGVTQRLGFYVNVTSPITMDRKILMWKRQEQPTTQSIKLQVNTPHPIKIHGAASDHPAVKAKVETVNEGRDYQLYVTPMSMSEAVSARITILAEGLEPLVARVRIR